MKKIIGLFLIVVLMVSLVSCSAPQEEAMEEKSEEKAMEPKVEEAVVEQQNEEPVATQEPEQEVAEEVVAEEDQEDGEKVAKYSNISQDEAKRLMDEQNPIVLDVREQYEYDEIHITGATLLPLGSIESDIATVTEDKDALILVYCRSGNRSRTATEILVNLGYTNVHDFGGIKYWEYETE